MTCCSRRSLLLLVSAVVAWQPTAHALRIEFDFSAVDARNELDAATRESVRAGYRAGGDIWEAVLTDPVELRVLADFAPLGTDGSISRSRSSTNRVSYSTVHALLEVDAKSSDDRIAVENLPSNAVGFRYLENPLGANTDNVEHARIVLQQIGAQLNDGSNGATEDNRFLAVSTANMKALGLAPRYSADPTSIPVVPDVAIDGSIVLSSAFDFDTDPLDGIATHQFDFAGVVAHELGHILGFASGADVLDLLTGRGACRDYACGFAGPGAGVRHSHDGVGDIWGWNATVLDLYRYSGYSLQFDAHDLTSGLGTSRVADSGSPRPRRIEDVLPLLPIFYYGPRGRTGLFGTGLYNGFGVPLTACESATTGDAFVIAPNTNCPLGTTEFEFVLPPDQASHWVDLVFDVPNASLTAPLGLMDGAREGPGTHERLSELDLVAFDVIGWDRQRSTNVVAPVGAMVLLPGIAAVLLLRKDNRRRRIE